MPLYSYHCADCDKDSELLMRSDDTAVCPACGGAKMERLLTSRVSSYGGTRNLLSSARSRAAKEGHFSNYSRGETKGKI